MSSYFLLLFIILIIRFILLLITYINFYQGKKDQQPVPYDFKEVIVANLATQLFHQKIVAKI